MTQQIIVYVIGAIVAVIIAINIYRFISQRKSPCASCAGCDLKDTFQKKQLECKENPSTKSSNSKPPCCG